MYRDPSVSCFKYLSGTQGLFEELGWHAKRGESQESPNYGACKESDECVLSDCASDNSKKQNCVDHTHV